MGGDMAPRHQNARDTAGFPSTESGRSQLWLAANRALELSGRRCLEFPELIKQGARARSERPCVPAGEAASLIGDARR